MFSRFDVFLHIYKRNLATIAYPGLTLVVIQEDCTFPQNEPETVNLVILWYVRDCH